MKTRATRCLALLSLLTACAGEAPPEGGGGPGQMPPPEVTVVTLAPRKVELTTELPGRTAPYLAAEVRPQVAGLVLERRFTEGADVKAGDVLYLIDSASYEVAVSAARAHLARAEASLAQLSARSGRIDKLVAQDIASAQENDDARGGVRSARAEVAAARAALTAAELDLSRTKITAPISGRVGRGSVMPGAMVVPYQTPLATLQQLDPIYVDITRSSVEVLRLKRALAEGKLARAGDGAVAVSLVLEDGTPYTHPGTLQFADATVDPATNAVTLRAVFPNPDLDLLPGMYVRAKVVEGVVEAALLVPQQGVSRDPMGQATALVVKPDGMVEARVLDVDRTLGADWLVKGGVAAGDQVIVEGLQKAQPGAPAKAVPLTPAKP